MNAEAARVGAAAAGAPDAADRMRTLKREVDSVRQKYTAAAAAGSKFLVENRNITAASTQFNDALAKQKIRMRDVVGSMHTVNQAYREQLALSKMTVASWTRTATGKVGVTMAVPNAEQIRMLDTWRTKMGFASKVVRSMSTEVVNLGKNIQWSGRQLTVGFTMPISMAAGAMGKFAYDLDRDVTNITKVYDAGADGIKMSNEQIRQQAVSTSKAMAQTYGQSSKDTLQIMQELAAAGKTGNDLVEQTRSITRAALAGDLDIQTALQTNITLQSAYNLSTKDLANTWAFFNSIENSTVLTMQDISEAIPRVSGIMKTMGVSIQDTTVLLTAFKSAGIDAVEGATALKSIGFRIEAPTKDARKAFKQLTGIDYQDVLDKTKGDFMATLKEISKAMQGLSMQEQTELISRVAGIHQGSRFAGLLTQLANINDATTQVGRAAQVAQQDSSEWTKTFNGELKTLTDSLSNRVKKALADAQVQLAEIGQTVLKIGAPIFEMVAGFLKWFNSLPEGAKRTAIIVALLTAAVGPLVMLSGLFLNMIGTVAKFSATLVDQATKFQILNAESKAAALLSKANATFMSHEAAQRMDLTAAIQQQTAAIQRLMAANEGLNGLNAIGAQAVGVAPRNPVVTRGGGITGRIQQGVNLGIFTQSSQAGINALPNISKWQQAVAASSANTAQTSATTAKNWTIMEHKAQGFAAAAALGVATLSSNEWVSNLATAGFLLASFGPALLKTAAVSKVIGLIGGKFKGLWALLASAGGEALASIMSKMKGLLAFATGPWGIGIAAAIGLGIYAVHKYNQAIDESNRHMKAALNDTKAAAAAVGFQYKSIEKLARDAGNGAVSAAQKANRAVNRWRKTNKDSYDELHDLGKQGISDQEALNIAIQKGLDARLHGATTKQAERTAQIALRIMGRKFSDADFELNIAPKLHFGSAQAQLNQFADQAKKTLDFVFSNRGEQRDSFWETVGRSFGAGDIFNTIDENMLKKTGKSIGERLVSATAEQRPRIIAALNKQFQGPLEQAYQNAIETAYIKKGTSRRQFIEQAVRDYNSGDIETLNRVTGGQAQVVAGYAELMKSAAKVTGVNKSQATSIDNINSEMENNARQARLAKEATDADAQSKQRFTTAAGGAAQAQAKQTDVLYANTDAHSRQAAAVKKGIDAGKKQSDAARASAAALDGDTDATFRNLHSKKAWEAALKKANKVVEQQKQVMTDVQSAMFDHMSNLAQNFDERQDEARQALEQRRANALQNRFDNMQKEVDTRADRQEKALDARLERGNNALDRRQSAMEARFDARSDAMDARFDRQQRALDRRRDAEDRAFEARWDAMQDRMEKRQQDRRDAVSKAYDDRIAAVNKEINAEEKAEETRQKIFEAEKARISNMAEMFNQNVDFNVAVNSGNLDDAAKIANDMQASQEQWAIDDVASESQTGSEKRINSYNKEIDRLNEIKDRRLKNLDEIDDAEKKAFDKRRDRAQREIKYAREDEDARIKASQDAARKRLEIERKNGQDRIDAQRKTLQKQIDLQKQQIQKAADLEKDALDRSLKRQQNKMDKENKAHADMIRDERERRDAGLAAELSAIRAYVPKNMTELREQIRLVTAAYKRHGIKMNGLEDKWTDVYQNMIVNKTKESHRQIRDKINWKQLGKRVANLMLNGSMDMNAREAMKFLATGKLPARLRRRYRSDRDLGSDRGTAKHRDYAGSVYHTGGVVGKSAGGRVGYARDSARQQSEVDTRLLVGEGVLNRRAMARPGMKDLVNLANQGKVSDLIGDGTGTSGFVAGPVSMFASGGVAPEIMATYTALMEQAAAGAASATVTGGGLSAEQRRNAAIILGVGKGMGATRRDLVVSIMTAMQESGLRNLHYGDRDSLGLFQQRPSAGWGTPRQLTNPRYAAGKFFQSLLAIGNRGEMSLAGEAQAVQRSAFPSAYAKWADLARSVVGGARFGTGGGAFSGLANVNMAQLLKSIATGGGGGINAGNGDYRRLWQIVKSHFPEAILTSGYRPGSRVAGFGNLSMHAMGRAIDVAPEKKIWNWLRREFPNSFELLSPWGMYRNGKPYYSAITQANHQDHIHWALTHGGKIPGLEVGGKTLNTGLARLHPDEMILTKPLTAKLESGIERIDSGASVEYNVEVNLNGPVSKDFDFREFKSNVKRVLIEVERESGPKRRIG